MVYCDQDMCESKLGRLMQAFRADRPSEWQMDEFIGMAEQMHKEIEILRQAEKDAARYRWLRDDYRHEYCVDDLFDGSSSSVDNRIDEAILNAKGDSLRRRWEGNFAGASAPLVLNVLLDHLQRCSAARARKVRA